MVATVAMHIRPQLSCGTERNCAELSGTARAAVRAPWRGRCVDRLEGRMKLVGESTLGQMYELMLAHMNTSGFYWPHRLEVDDARNYYGRTDQIRAQGLHSEFHGMSVVHELAEEELVQWPPSIVVQLQARCAETPQAQFGKRRQAWPVGQTSGLAAADNSSPPAAAEVVGRSCVPSMARLKPPNCKPPPQPSCIPSCCRLDTG